MLVFIVAAPFCIHLSAVSKGSKFSIFLTKFLKFMKPSNSCEVISHCSFDLHFPDIRDIEHLFI